MRLFLFFIFLFFLDQLSKTIVFQSYAFFNEMMLIEPFLSLQLAINYGAAWGFFSHQRWLLISTHFFALFFVFYYLKSLKRGYWTALSLPFLFAGIFGNGFDRIKHGFVIDFIKVGAFPIFNFADIYLTFTGFCFLMALWKGDEFFR